MPQLKSTNNKKINKLLLELYQNYKSNTGFSNINTLYNAAKNKIPDITRDHVKAFLKTQDSYTLHKITNKRFKYYRKVLSPRPKSIISLDIIDMPKLVKENDGYRYLLYFVDTFSRFNTVIPLKTKNQIDLLAGLKTFFKIGDNIKYKYIYSDEEGALYSNAIQKYFKENNIIIYSNSSKETKNSVAESNLKFLKHKIFRYLTHNSTNTYINVLPDIVSAINNSNKKVFKNKFLTPQILHEIRSNNYLKNQFHIMNPGIYSKSKKGQTQLFKKNDYVRIPKVERTQNPFFKGYDINQTTEIFVIDDIDKSIWPYLYKLRDLAGDRIKGSFYQDELVLTSLNNKYKIEILDEKNDKNKGKMYFVRYLGYPDKFSEWIKASQILS